MTAQRILPAEAAALMNDQGYVYVDVRSVPEFDAGHPTGAYNIPLMHAGAGGMKPNPDFLKVFGAVFPKDQKLIIACQAGVRSKRAVDMLVAQGYQNIADQSAGFGGARDAFGAIAQPGWQAAGLPVSMKSEAEHSYDELLKKAGG